MILVGSSATPEDSAIHIRQHTPAGGSGEGSAQYISSRGRCFATQAGAKGGRGSEGTYHSRIWQNAADEFHEPRATITPMHHERLVTCNGRPNDAVYKDDPDCPGRGGFDGGAARFWEGFNRNDGHRQVRVDEVPDKRTFKQCNGDVAGWNGRILWFSHGNSSGTSGSFLPATQSAPSAAVACGMLADGCTAGGLGSEVAADLCTPEVGNRLAYWLGATFEGLNAAPAARVCQPEHPVNPALAANNYISFIYGGCTPPGDVDEARCTPPLEVQTAPTAERHRTRYTFAGEPYPNTRFQLANGAIKTTSGYSFDGGRVIEIYTNEPTISLFGNDPEQVRRAADTVQRVARTRIQYPASATLEDLGVCGRDAPKPGCYEEVPDPPPNPVGLDDMALQPPQVINPAPTPSTSELVESALKTGVDPALAAGDAFTGSMCSERDHPLREEACEVNRIIP